MDQVYAAMASPGKEVVMPAGSRSKASKHVLCDPAIHRPLDAHRLQQKQTKLGPRHVGDHLCIPDAITNVLSDSTVYAPITTVDQELRWVEEDGEGAAAQRTSSVRGMEHTDLNAFLRSLCDANGGTHIEVIAAACTARSVPITLPRLPTEAPNEEVIRMQWMVLDGGNFVFQDWLHAMSISGGCIIGSDSQKAQIVDVAAKLRELPASEQQAPLRAVLQALDIQEIARARRIVVHTCRRSGSRNAGRGKANASNRPGAR
jgi:hypothetical protein